MKKTNFDFSEISGTNPIVSAPRSSVPKTEDTEPQKEKPKHKPTGIQLAIPTEGGWLDRDLSDCSPEEFALWVEFVFPAGSAPESLDAYKHLAVRVDMFKKMVNFHRNINFSNKKKQAHIA